MESPIYRERVLLGYDARGTLGGPYSYSSPKFPFRHSEVDFSDVFGGPPRCSTEEVGHSYREAVILNKKEEEQLPSAHSDPWAGLGQRSVFGEQSPSRRLLAKDFYNDIFKVDDPLGSRRRYSDISHCSASIPVSRVLSPVHPSIPDTHEPSSLAKPALLRQLSLSRLGRRTDNLASAPPGGISPNRSKHGVGGSQRLKDQGSPGNTKESSQSHFSLYKWATKGIPLTSAFKGGNRKDSNLVNKKNDIPSGSAMGTVKRGQLSLVDENTLAEVLANDKPDDIGSDSVEDQDGNKERMPSKPGADTLYALLSKDNDENAEGENSILNDHDTQHKGNHDNVIDSVKRENAQQAHKRRLGKENKHKGGNVTNLPQDASVIKEEVVGKRENGKVQEFVKMFSHEEQLKPTRRRESNALKLKKNLSQQTKLEEGSSKKSVEHNDVKVNQMSEQPEQLHFGSKGTISETFDTSIQCIEVENIIEDHDPQQTPMNQQGESIQFLDTKIEKWSNGREENLRALLSTLQYVLWPESGWKPVPLVDIIESASVKRAYQKTMLYLHPDKLQQKGASSQQKYTADKVFDILQEAWTHFNTLSAL